MGQRVDGADHQRPERMCRDRAAVEVPEECLSKLLLGFREDFYGEATHRLPSRALTEAHGCAVTRPAR